MLQESDTSLQEGDDHMMKLHDAGNDADYKQRISEDWESWTEEQHFYLLILGLLKRIKEKFP